MDETSRRFDDIGIARQHLADAAEKISGPQPDPEMAIAHAAIAVGHVLIVGVHWAGKIREHLTGRRSR